MVSVCSGLLDFLAKVRTVFGYFTREISVFVFLFSLFFVLFLFPALLTGLKRAERLNQNLMAVGGSLLSLSIKSVQTTPTQSSDCCSFSHGYWIL